MGTSVRKKRVHMIGMAFNLGHSYSQTTPYSHTTPSLSASRMYGYAGCDRGTGAIPCRLASLQVILPLALSS